MILLISPIYVENSGDSLPPITVTLLSNFEGEWSRKSNTVYSSNETFFCYLKDLWTQV